MTSHCSRGQAEPVTNAPNRDEISNQSSRNGQLVGNEKTIRRTLDLTTAAILNNFTRIVEHWADANVVPQRAVRRNVSIKTYEKLDSSRRKRFAVNS